MEDAEEEGNNENEDQDQDQDDFQSQTQTQIHEQDPEDSDSDEEDQPLALMNGTKPQAPSGLVPVRHGGKKAAGHMTVAGTAPAPQTAHPLKHSSDIVGMAGKPIGRLEELGEEQLQRLATGVTVDTEGENIQVMFLLRCLRL